MGLGFEICFWYCIYVANNTMRKNFIIRMLYNNTFWFICLNSNDPVGNIRTVRVLYIYRYYNIVCNSFAFDRWSLKHLLTYLLTYIWFTLTYDPCPGIKLLNDHKIIITWWFCHGMQLQSRYTECMQLQYIECMQLQSRYTECMHSRSNFADADLKVDA